MGFNGRLSFIKKIQKTIITNNYFLDSYLEVQLDNNNKFYNDRIFIQENDNIILLDGVILNNHELEKVYNRDTWIETFKVMCSENISEALNKLRGSFCGLIYNKKENELILFTDQYNTRKIYFSLIENELIFNTNISSLAEKLKASNELDESAAYLLLTFGGTLEERTLFKNIKKLNYGTIFTVHINRKISKKQYYVFNNSEDSKISKENAIEKIDFLFRRAIVRQFNKDNEYGYSHIAELSAGRDSRMTVWVANTLGYNENFLATTFSETFENDELIAKQIANDLKCEWIFKMLNNGNCMYYIEEITKRVCGEVSLGTLHSYFMKKDIDMSKYGIIHTGQIGDGVISDYGDKDLVLSYDNLSKVGYIYSTKLLEKVISKKIIKNFYQNEEVFNHVNRGIYVTNMSEILFDDLYYISPFLDIDLLNYCLKIPKYIRKGNSLYDSWILKKYPNAAKYKHNGRKIGEKEINMFGKIISISKIMLKLKILKIEKGMNPFDEWYKNNKKLKSTFDDYFNNNIDEISNYPELKMDCKYLYESGNAREKAQVIGLLATVKLFMKDNKNGL